MLPPLTGIDPLRAARMGPASRADINGFATEIQKSRQGDKTSQSKDLRDSRKRGKKQAGPDNDLAKRITRGPVEAFAEDDEEDIENRDPNEQAPKKRKTRCGWRRKGSRSG